MEDKFLQEFLKTGLFDIGDNDDRLKKLRQAIADLEIELNKDYSLLSKYILVALDVDISDSELPIIETEAIIVKYWDTLRSKYSTMPISIIRGVILNALYRVGRGDALAARIIYLTASNFYPYAKLNNEKKVIELLLTELSEIAEVNAIEEWALIEEEPSLKLSVLKIGSVKFEPIKLDKNILKVKLTEALGQAPSGHGPEHGLQEPNYKAHFISKTLEGISSSFDIAFEKFNNSSSSTEIETPINKFFSEFKKSLDTNLKASFASITAVERRSKLLWWKETLYSSSLKKSYRGLDKYLLPIIMSYDLNKQLPEITPISVDFLLKDTLYLLVNKEEESIKFQEYLLSISNNDSKKSLKPYFNDLNEVDGRISITDFIALLANDRVKMSDFKNRTGIDENERITLIDLSVTILHDLLTQRLIL